MDRKSLKRGKSSFSRVVGVLKELVESLLVRGPFGVLDITIFGSVPDYVS